jgi:hypothetical protein
VNNYSRASFPEFGELVDEGLARGERREGGGGGRRKGKERKLKERKGNNSNLPRRT